MANTHTGPRAGSAGSTGGLPLWWQVPSSQHHHTQALGSRDCLRHDVSWKKAICSSWSGCKKYSCKVKRDGKKIGSNCHHALYILNRRFICLAKSTLEWVTRARACNYVKIETGQNFAIPISTLHFSGLRWRSVILVSHEQLEHTVTTTRHLKEEGGQWNGT